MGAAPVNRDHTGTPTDLLGALLNVETDGATSLPHDWPQLQGASRTRADCLRKARRAIRPAQETTPGISPMRERNERQPY